MHVESKAYNPAPMVGADLPDPRQSRRRCGPVGPGADVGAAIPVPAQCGAAGQSQAQMRMADDVAQLCADMADSRSGIIGAQSSRCARDPACAYACACARMRQSVYVIQATGVAIPHLSMKVSFAEGRR